MYAVKNVICVKTGLDWRKLRFKMERIWKKGKQHDISDSAENWPARGDVSESVCS